jgi:hypothetical protein
MCHTKLKVLLCNQWEDDILVLSPVWEAKSIQLKIGNKSKTEAEFNIYGTGATNSGRNYESQTKSCNYYHSGFEYFGFPVSLTQPY